MQFNKLNLLPLSLSFELGLKPKLNYRIKSILKRSIFHDNVGTAFSLYATDRMGRKLILLLSAIGMALSLIILGVSFTIQTHDIQGPIRKNFFAFELTYPKIEAKFCFVTKLFFTRHIFTQGHKHQSHR